MIKLYFQVYFWFFCVSIFPKKANNFYKDLFYCYGNTEFLCQGIKYSLALFCVLKDITVIDGRKRSTRL